MYSYVDSVSLSRSIGSQWQHVDLSNIIVYDIFANYSRVYLILSHPALVDNVNVDLEILRLEFSSYSGTLAELLVLLGDRSLETVAVIPTTAIKFAKYSDAVRSGYKIHTTIIGASLPDNYPETDKHDLAITRPNTTTDMELIQSHCLVSVNGYFHATDTDGVKAYVYKGADTMRKSRVNHLGILSFLDVGALTKIPLLPANIVGQTESAPLKDRIIFSITQDLTNKSFFLVLGGYLVFPHPNVFWRNGEKTFALDLNMLPYLERLYESKHYMDLTALGLSSFPINPDLIDLEEVWSDAILKNYLTLSQSFLVLVDTPNLLTNNIYLRHSDLPGMFTAYQDPVYPLIVNYGKAVEYWKTREDNHWSVTVQDSFLRNFVLSQQSIAQLPYMNGNLIPQKPYWNSRGYLLEISGFN